MKSCNLSSSNAAIAATAGAMFSLLPVAAHQIGMIKHLPDPPGSIFDSDRITTSRMAHPRRAGCANWLGKLCGYAGTAAGHAVHGVCKAAASRETECGCNSGGNKCDPAGGHFSADMLLVRGHCAVHSRHRFLRATQCACGVELCMRTARTPFPVAIAS